MKAVQEKLYQINRVMFAGTNSGCGKTTVTCGILQALVNKGISVSSLKCGPDYIDPMFHSKVIGTRAGNIDSYFTEEEVLQDLLYKNSIDSDICIMEGVMGYYDGIGFTSEGSGYSIAAKTSTPVILIIDAKGMSTSIGAIMEGFINYKKNSNIKGVIFNRLAPTLYEGVKKLAQEMGLQVLGYVPAKKEFMLESRHLGLVTADELTDLKEKLVHLGDVMLQTIDLDGILALSKSAPAQSTGKNLAVYNTYKARIGIAKDEAFCFYYRENLELLQSLGAELVYFSPLHDNQLPPGLNGLYLGGGYPELYGKELAENKNLLKEIRTLISRHLPTIAECGGFMYLHEELEDKQGEVYKMAGVIPGRSYKTERLQHFGYIQMTAKKDSMLTMTGEVIKAHEFHYWESNSRGNDFHIIKAAKNKEWEGVHTTDSFYGGYPHLYFYSDPNLGERFVRKCSEYIYKDKTEIS